LEDLDIEFRIILNLISKKYDGRARSGFLGLRIVDSVGLL
jgi:hypothetical protein